MPAKDFQAGAWHAARPGEPRDRTGVDSRQPPRRLLELGFPRFHREV